MRERGIDSGESTDLKDLDFFIIVAFEYAGNKLPL